MEINRLRKLREKEDLKMTKTASTEIHLAGMDLKSGDIIELNTRFVNNKPWFQIKHEHSWEASSFYDGSDYKRAFQIYADLVMTFKGVAESEEFVKSIPSLLSKIEKFSDVPDRSKFMEYHNLIQKSPKFLGFTDF